jgi:hypothetical protein
MVGDKKEEWLDLCERAANEQDHGEVDGTCRGD